MSRALRRTISSIRHSSFLALPFDVQEHASSVSPPQNERQQKFQALRNSLNNSRDPSNVWTHYVSLMSSLGYEQLDLSLHQEVLRKCTLPSKSLRSISSRRLRYNDDPLALLSEGRFQTIIRNIRALGTTPSIDDYHFILEQFAAVGHHVGAMQVYREFIQTAVPQKKTFGLCLQAIAHRLSLPVNPKEKDRSQQVMQARTMMSELLAGMQKYSVPFSSINLDFTIRIMKETADEAGFESLMKLGYGIDLAYPDHPSLEMLGERQADSNASVSAQPLYFSVSALNAVIDMYGKSGNISRMVQAFEVLTVPLPQAQQYFSSSFEEDDDDFGVASRPSVMPSFTPSTRPNTSTLKILLRHLAHAGHFQLMRHYLLVAMELDRETDRQTRRSLVTTPNISQVPSPTFAIDRDMLFYAFGESNREKNLAFMKWLARKIPRIIKKKENDLKFYRQFKKGLQKRSSLPIAPTMAALGQSSDAPSAPASTSRSPDAASAFKAPPKPVWGYFRGYRWKLADVESVLTADVTNEKSTDHSGPPPFKPFNLNLHIQTLENDIKGLIRVKERLDTVKARTHERIKDRLGRRVWSSKDVYLSTGGSRRGRVSRVRWRDMVNYKLKAQTTETVESAETTSIRQHVKPL